MDSLTNIVVLAAIIFISIFAGIMIGRGMMQRSFEARLKEWKLSVEKELRADAISRSRVTLGGKLSEQLAPYFPDFPYDPTEVRFIGSPVDFVVFSGIAKGEPEEIVFVEVKSGKGKLSGRQERLRKVVEERKVRWEEYRVE